jgi:ABC-type uncharacterized transport system involved in gliding motility auxiliary subunit
MKTSESRAFWKASGGLASLALLLVVLVAANMVIGQLRLRVDLTGEKLYTLSDGSRNLLGKLEEPVTLKLFFNRSAPEVPVTLKAYARQVEDLLHEYRMAANGNVILEIHDPKPDSEAEEWAQSYGITSQTMEMFGPPLFFGVVAISGTQEAVIPALDPRTDRLLEYNVTRLIDRVAHPDRPVIGVMSSQPVLGDEAAPSFGMTQPRQKEAWLAFQEIQEDYVLRRLPSDADEIPAEVQALILVNPKALSEATVFAIDQFVLRGGRLLAFVDPMNVADLENQEQDPFGQQDTSSGLERLFSAWGVTYDSAQLVADLKAASRLRGANNSVEESLLFLSLGKDHVNADDILTSQLGMIMLPFAGSFAVQPKDGLTSTPLLTTSDMSGTVSAMMARFGSASVNREFKPGPLHLNMAVRLNGTFNTAFPNGRPVPAGETNAAPAATTLKDGTSTVILVADADLIYDRFCVQELSVFGARALQPLNDNVRFFGNAVEQVAGSSDLVGIRSRGEFFRPFERVLALENEARRLWQEKEQALVQKLEDTQSQLNQLQTKKDEGQQFILSPEQKDAIERYRDQEIAIRRDLKDVRKSLRQEIERLGLKVKLANIVVMPLLISLGGLTYGLSRRRR